MERGGRQQWSAEPILVAGLLRGGRPGSPVTFQPQGEGSGVVDGVKDVCTDRSPNLLARYVALTTGNRQ